ncbi:hypothetical protein K7X08_004828 [Anisodus acutangulus]|uniref:C2H2-type domain-containing protein n=1 Tax=Anisodus acutangulus TaxID=402998 RepID=A0A9Q1MJE6_9SOLA|nr:hypothetical protein K7X08_004828 [Anisodus acutangulus]
MAGMERNSFNSCFMARHMKRSNSNDNNNNVKEYSSWDYYYYGNEDDGLMCLPPRSYTCSFCKREFKLAQALGGHMNVHRRDRAKFMMRQQSPPPPPTDKYRNSLLNLNLDPNLNPSFSSSTPPPSPSRKFSHYTSRLPFDPSSGGGSHEMKKWGKGVVPNNHLKSSAKTLLGVEKLGSLYMQENEFLRLDLEIGLYTESKQDLDLELRLGYT